MIQHIERQMPPLAHTAVYNWHKYWARKTWNVVGEFIDAYCPKGGVVLDPFAGSGLIGIEAVRRGRRAILSDITPVTAEIVWASVVDVTPEQITEAFNRIETAVGARIESLYRTACPKCGVEQPSLANVWTDGHLERLRYRCVNPNCQAVHDDGAEATEDDIRRADLPEKLFDGLWYPRQSLEYPDGQPFLKREHYTTIASLFTRRNLLALSLLMAEIEKEGPKMRRLLRATFTSFVHLASRMCPALSKGAGNHQTPYSSTWSQQSYWSAPRALEVNVWKLFRQAVSGNQGILRAKEESLRFFPNGVKFTVNPAEVLSGDADLCVVTDDGVRMMHKLPAASVDYIFTDPPYDISIQYGELCFLWVCWLRKDAGYLERLQRAEIINNKSQHKTQETFQAMLRNGFKGMHHALKPDAYATVTFHNPSMAVRKATIEAGIYAGYVFEKIHHQPLAVNSAKSMLQPFGSAQGDFYLRFYKSNSDGPSIPSSKKVDDERFERVVVSETIEILAHRGEPTPYAYIINKIDPALAANGFFSSLSSGLDVKKVLQAHLGKEFELRTVAVGDQEGEMWWFRDASLIAHPEIPLSERVEETVLRQLKGKGTVTFTEVWEAVGIEFPNSLTPDTTSIVDALRTYARQVGKGGKWLLKPEVAIRENEHNEIIAALAEIGTAWGYKIWVGKKEQSAWVHGSTTATRKLSEFVTADLTQYRSLIADMAAASQLDCVWVAPNGPVACFEVEATTSMTSGLQRGSNLLGSVRKYLVIPEEREGQLERKMRSPLFADRWTSDGWETMHFDHIHQRTAGIKKAVGKWESLKGAVGLARQRTPNAKQLALKV